MKTLRDLLRSVDEKSAGILLDAPIIAATDKNGVVVLVLEVSERDDDDDE